MGKMLECWVCGAMHDYCPTCGQTHGWKYIADTRECYTIYVTIEDYKAGAITKEQAASTLSNICNLHDSDDLSWLLPHIARDVREIIGKKEKTIRKSKLYKDED